MNKEKAIETINNIIAEIRAQSAPEEWEESKLYIECWVFGSLKTLESKIKGESIYNYEKTYNSLFKEFVSYYFCRRIDPSIKLYAISCLFSIKVRDLICDLYRNMFDKKQRQENATAVNYWFDYCDKNNKSTFEIIRSYTTDSQHQD